LRIDPRPQYRLVDRFRDEIIGPRLEAQYLALFPTVTRQHDRRDLGDGGIAVAPQFFQNLRAIHSRHIEIQEEKRRRIVLERF
jgi:hypothetical protein